MGNAEKEDIWYARLPHEWAAAPEWMSFSRLSEIEACPRRWSLNSASYPEIWSRRGYPPKVYFASLSGQIIHAALEIISNALNKAGCSSTTDECFVRVMREQGGFTKIIEAAIKSLCNDLYDNPRFTSKLKYISIKLRNSVPALREQLQIMSGKLRLQGGFVATTTSRSRGNYGAIRGALSNGTYSEIELRAASLRWRGFVDVLTLSDVSCEIIDYKTGMPKPEHEEQVRLYSLLWARDVQLNPSGRTVDHLTLAYSTTDVNVEPLTRSQLDVLELEIISRTRVAYSLAQQSPPPAFPSIHKCEFCPVRQLCDEYWTPQVQQMIAQEVEHELPSAGEYLVDLEIDNLQQQTPLSWNAVVILCRDLPAGTDIMIKDPEPSSVLHNKFNSGSRIRILDAFLVKNPENTTTIVLLTGASEVFVV